MCRHNSRNPSLGSGGFTLIELLLAVILISIIGAIVIPRYMINQREAKIQACEIQRSIINKGVERFFMVESTWPANSLSDLRTNDMYFPDGIPTCPIDLTSYRLMPSPYHRVSGHREGSGTHLISGGGRGSSSAVCNTNADCNDSDPSTADQCYCGGTGSAFCDNPPNPCFDGILGVWYNCIDANPNTLDQCDGVGGCINTPVVCGP